MLQRSGMMVESLPDLEAANRLSPGNVRILDLIGLAYLALERPAEAEKVLRQALAKEPENPEVISALGTSRNGSGKRRRGPDLYGEVSKNPPARVAQSPEASRDDGIGNTLCKGTEGTPN